MTYHHAKSHPIWPSNEAKRANLMMCHFCGKALTWLFRQILKNITTPSNDRKLAIYHHRIVPKVANERHFNIYIFIFWVAWGKRLRGSLIL